MKEKNNYGMMSGGFIFDALDRTALEAVNQRFNNADKLIFTRTAEIDYRKQLCNLRGVKTIVDFVEYDTAHRQYVAGVKLRQIDTDIAYGTFYFKQAFKNFCEIRE